MFKKQMATATTNFLNLPSPIIKGIIKHIDNVALYRHYVFIKNDYAKASWYSALMALGGMWEEHVHERLFQNVYFGISWPEGYELYNSVDNELDITLNGMHLPKVDEAKLVISINEIFNGRIVEPISSLVDKGLVFSNATKVIVKDNRYSMWLYNNNHEPANVQKFVSVLRKLFPSAKSFNLELCSARDADIEKFAACTVELLNEFKRLSNHVHLENYSTGWMETLPATMLTNLTSLAIGCNNKWAGTSSLVRQNAPTLENLDMRIVISTSMNYNFLLRDAKNSIVIYPQLKRLRIRSYSSKKAICASEVEYTTVFPVLEIADIQTDYPFSDDVLFRGNHCSLEHVGLSFQDTPPSLVEKLASRRAEYKCMKSIDLELPHSNPTKNKIVAGNMPSFISTFGDNLTKLCIAKLDFMDIVMPAVRNGKVTLQKLQLLEGDCMLTLCDVVKMLQHLPSLTDLRSGFQGMGKKYKHVEIWTLADKLKDQHGKLSNVFKSWNLGSRYKLPVQDSVTTSFILSVLCPQFVSVIAKPLDVNKYNKLTKELLAKCPSEYTSYFRLLYYSR